MSIVLTCKLEIGGGVRPLQGARGWTLPIGGPRSKELSEAVDYARHERYTPLYDHTLSSV